MRKRLPKILVTGGAGFMGSEFVRQAIKRDCPESLRQLRGIHPERSEGPSKLRGLSLIVVDKLTYAGDLRRLDEVKAKYKFYKADICNKALIELIFRKERPDNVVHFAASTHVDRSIQAPSVFIETNIRGTQVLLDAAKKYKIKKFIQISSDEVYGEIKKGSFSENSPLQPNSPYAATKAAAELLIKAYIRTYGFPAIIVRPCNNYGPWQYPEKLIPLAILKALRNEKIPVYGKGQNIREWLYVTDCIDAIFLILEEGKIGEIYNIGSGQEKRNIDVVKQILDILGKPESLIELVKDRPGHDFRYRLNSEKIRKEIGWQPKIKFARGLENTVKWYIEYKDWLLSKPR
ncbi:MAG: dTDP-glucose 4,6-dehydratase [Candidatus Omnitrophota bacterium]|nr:dTDP-glucose 4,6-dehydratase [Candidatus Omnitrophota bacterium]